MSGTEPTLAHPATRHPSQGTAAGPYRLTRQRIYILPTRHGLSFGAALTVMLIGSINYDNSLGYLLSFLLAGVALVSMLHAYRNLAGLELRAAPPEPVFAGEQARVPVTIDNRSGAARHALLVLHPAYVPGAPPPRCWARPWSRQRRAGPDDEAIAAVSVDGGALRRLDLPVRLRRRGPSRVAGLVVASRYPLGLFRAWSPVRLAPVALAYPTPAGDPELPPSQAPTRSSGGRAAGGQEDFSGLREYRLGDSPRRIHWKAVARGQGMPVKVFEGLGAAETRLEWEATRALADPERRLSQLCRWVLEADKAGSPYGLSLPGTDIPADAGPGHRARCLAALAEVEPYPSAPDPPADPSDGPPRALDREAA